MSAARRSRCHPLGQPGVRDGGHLPGLFHPPRGGPGEDEWPEFDEFTDADRYLLRLFLFVV
jgi:hypothetical protein